MNVVWVGCVASGRAASHAAGSLPLLIVPPLALRWRLPLHVRAVILPPCPALPSPCPCPAPHGASESPSPSVLHPWAGERGLWVWFLRGETTGSERR